MLSLTMEGVMRWMVSLFVLGGCGFGAGSPDTGSTLSSPSGAAGVPPIGSVTGGGTQVATGATGTGASTGTGGTTGTGLTTGTATATGSSTSPTTLVITCQAVPPVTGDAATVPLAGSCDPANLWGGVWVSQMDAFSVVSGQFADGVVPVTVQNQLDSAGDCVLEQRGNPFCDPACQPNETCDFSGACIPFPVNLDVGTLTLGGLAVDVILNPVQPGNTYFATNLPHPVTVPDQVVELRNCGNTGAVGPFEMHGLGVEPLTGLSGALSVERGTDLTLTWDAPVGLARGEVALRFSVDQHGLTPAQIRCSFVDDGAGTVPTTLVDALLDLGVTGFPSASVARRTVDSVILSTGGCAEFVVENPHTPAITVDGYVACVTDQDCPTGQTCNLTSSLCE